MARALLRTKLTCYRLRGHAASSAVILNHTRALAHIPYALCSHIHGARMRRVSNATY